jgi:hypothetical protein
MTSTKAATLPGAPDRSPRETVAHARAAALARPPRVSFVLVALTLLAFCGASQSATTRSR